ncbi:YegP family protein [Limisalsivibrio acetivorans]|uniref:YegP family protein n=1 Tax=Limisalsivibrio acetivorans TaxID=1304888 RepID=UPI0003B376B8|nr:YegP family protein [Limisalsivibrio acetivorans]
MPGKFVIQNSIDGQVYFVLKAANGEVILNSETYRSKQSCKDGIESVRENSQYISNFEKKVSIRNDHYFNLKAMNGQVIGTSEMYTTSAARDKGISSVMNNAPDASISDET